MANLKINSEYKSSQLYRIRHSVAHIMAEAVLQFFPEAKIAIGPPIADGFYYDFDLPRALTEEDLQQIEARMREIAAKQLDFVCSEVTPEQAHKTFANQPYKLELIEGLLKGTVDENGEPLPQQEQPRLTIYQLDNFVDLCKGPHVSNTREIAVDAFKLLRTAGAYWRGDEERPMLQRIYGTAFETKQELENHLKQLEEAKRRDHRVLGKQLEFFTFSDEVGQGLPLWQPKGALVRYLADRFSQDAHLLNGYEWIVTPHIGKAQLWETSGHLDFYRDNMYRPIEIEDEQYFLKPMNCPFHIHIYKSRPRSYREMPTRFAEFGTVYRYERSGVLNGLTRVRGFTQDDAHIFCLPEQIGQEILSALRFSLYVLRSFGLKDFKAYLATRPAKKFVGSEAEWDAAIETLKEAVEKEGLPYEVDEGGGAFYGPKIDIKVLDFLGREWQLSTVQFDFNLPKRFGLEYIGADGEAHTPVMVHRALFGSCERFFAMLIEHYEGALPLWLSPVQVTIIPIAERHLEYASAVQRELKTRKIRAKIDDSGERMQAKIRNSEIGKVPYAFILGDKEASNNAVSIRARQQGDLGSHTIDEFMAKITEQLALGQPREIE